MAINKYFQAQATIHEAIHNMIEAGWSDPEAMANELFGKYRLEVAVYELAPSPKMIKQIYQLLCQQAYYDRFKNHNHALDKGE